MSDILDMIRVPPRGRRARPGRPRFEIGELTPPRQVAEPKKRGPKAKTWSERSIAGKLKATPGMDRATVSRLVSEPLYGKIAKMPPFNSRAIVEGRTVYPSTVLTPLEQVLKSGVHHAKLGGLIRKGRWKGMPVYQLTLEERATCPKDCLLWRACYGNNMHLSHRFEAGAALERRIEREIGARALDHPGGFVVRLHMLGDFYSVEYVALWRQLLAKTPELHVFGYSARWRREDPIAVALIQLAMENWDRFAIRFSNAPIDTCSTVTIEHEAQKPADAIICPEQLGKTESCSTCALCWSTEKRIAFIRH